MARFSIYISDSQAELLKKLAAENGLKVSQFISKLVTDAEHEKVMSIEKVESDLESIRRAENENSKGIYALMEMMNTYFKAFAGDETNSSTFYPIDETPHPWTRKSLEISESKIRMARYSKLVK